MAKKKAKKKKKKWKKETGKQENSDENSREIFVSAARRKVGVTRTWACQPAVTTAAATRW